ncbi:DUF3135 domain-containing protein [Marinobacter hydrocarbonoclasticus]|nr:DUF3135 domain-containing protein [Marinobacter nauticus]
MTSLPDFDTLQRMAQSDPDALQRLRQTLIDETIAAADPTHRPQLEALQSHVDRTLERASNPCHGMIQVMGMMQEKLYQLSVVLNDPDAYFRQEAKILSLRSGIEQRSGKEPNGA